MSDGDVEDGRCSFPTPKSHHINTSRRHQLYVTVEAQRSFADRGTTIDQDHPQSFAFEEYNGMRKVAKRKKKHGVPLGTTRVDDGVLEEPSPKTNKV